jgi:hypothetical protein
VGAAVAVAGGTAVGVRVGVAVGAAVTVAGGTAVGVRVGVAVRIGVRVAVGFRFASAAEGNPS